jgi:hypothetical protein
MLFFVWVALLGGTIWAALSQYALFNVTPLILWPF